MNVYDFDKTIFDGDSTVLFLRYLIRRRPSLVWGIPGIAAEGLLFAAGLREKQAFKERVFRASFGRKPGARALLDAFWDENAGGIKRWYLDRQRAEDVVITASPVEIVRPMCARLGIAHVLGSPVDLDTGLYSGKNCHGEEKVRRFYEEFPDATVDEFYSDSHSDDPMARIAGRAYWVRGDALEAWPWKEKRG